MSKKYQIIISLEFDEQEDADGYVHSIFESISNEAEQQASCSFATASTELIEDLT